MDLGRVCPQYAKIVKNKKEAMSFPIYTAVSANPWSLSLPVNNQTVCCNSTKIFLKPLNCIPLRQQVDCGVMCETCSGKGWLLCDLCKGQKTNVRADNNRSFRRCPACRAIGSVLCSKCKVYRCVVFPDLEDGIELSF